MKRILVAALVAAATACSEPAEPDPTATEPWTKQFTVGNFLINSLAVVTSADAVAHLKVTDVVQASALPATNFTSFTVHTLVPVDPGASTTVTSVDVRILTTDGETTANIFQSGEFVTQQVVNGQNHSVYRLTGFYNGSVPINRDRFSRATFTFTLQYKNGAGEVLNSSTRVVEIRKQ